MSGSRPEPAEAIREARRGLEGHRCARVVGELVWHDTDQRWAFPVELSVESKNRDLIPERTVWYFVLDPRYPWGEIEIYPASDGGIKLTFPHQDRNDADDTKVPWRSGDICVRAPAFALDRLGSDPDPKGSPDRLLWYVERALEWLARASEGTLAQPGDDFELPQWKALPLTVGSVEDADTFELWSSISDRVGTAELVQIAAGGPWVARRFCTVQGEKLIEPSWGRMIERSKAVKSAGWLRLPGVPVLPPYGAPAVWGDLAAAVDALGLRFDDLLQQVLKPLRDGERHMLLVGFPIPRRVGEKPSQMHWQPLQLPLLSSRKNLKNGFRANDAGFWSGDKATVLAPKQKIDWMTGRNWSQAEISTRGRFSSALRSKRVLYLGAGAVGSTVSELLIRGGVNTGVLVDNDSVAAGNLVRHTLSLTDVGNSKGEALALRLNGLNPHTKIEALLAHFPNLSESDSEKCLSCDLVLDCSGSDDVLQALADQEYADGTLFVTLSMGRGAGRFYMFHAWGRRFPIERFRDEISPWLVRDQEQFAHVEFPWEGIGCWHPVFPATPDQVWAFAAAAVRHLDSVAGLIGEPVLTVIELSSDNLPQRVSTNG